MNTRQFRPCSNCKTRFEKLSKENDCLIDRIEKYETFTSEQRAKINDFDSDLFMKQSELDDHINENSKLRSVINDLHAKLSAQQRNYDVLSEENELLKIELANTKVFPCALCGKHFARSDNRNRHQLSCKVSKRKISVLANINPDNLTKRARLHREEIENLNQEI